MKKVLSCFLVALVLVSSLSVTASAATAPDVESRSAWNYLPLSLSAGSTTDRTSAMYALRGYVNCTNSTKSARSCYAGVEVYDSGAWLLYGSTLIPNDGMLHRSTTVEATDGNHLTTRGVIGSSYADCIATGEYGFYS